MNFISLLIPETMPQRNIILDAVHVDRPSPMKAWWSDNGASEPATPREDRSFDFEPIGHYTIQNVTVMPDALALTEEGTLLLDHAIGLGASRVACPH